MRPPLRRLVWATLWMLIGGALTGGVYWGFLNTPESSVGSLLLSALLAVVSLALAGITINGALETWERGSSRAGVRRAAVNAPAILPALAIVFVLWWIAGRGAGWVFAHSGEISAWFIARFGREDVSALFTGVTWIARWLRWVVGPLLALSFLASIGAAGWSSAFGLRWIRHAMSPLRLILATVWFGVLVAVPWVYLAPWRPRGLPAVSVELAFIAAKLLITGVLMAMGVALMIRQAAPEAPAAPDVLDAL